MSDRAAAGAALEYAAPRFDLNRAALRYAAAFGWGAPT